MSPFNRRPLGKAALTSTRGREPSASRHLAVQLPESALSSLPSGVLHGQFTRQNPGRSVVVRHASGLLVAEGQRSRLGRSFRHESVAAVAPCVIGAGTLGDIGASLMHTIRVMTPNVADSASWRTFDLHSGLRICSAGESIGRFEVRPSTELPPWIDNAVQLSAEAGTKLAVLLEMKPNENGFCLTSTWNSPGTEFSARIEGSLGQDISKSTLRSHLLLASC